MARYNKLGYAIDQIICEDMALPNATNLTATNTVKLDAVKANRLRVIVCAASTSVTLSSAATLRFTPLFGNNPDAGGCLIRAMGTIEIKEGDVTLKDPGDVTTKDLPDPTTWTTGQLITAFNIPAELASAYKYMKLNIACSANESEDKIEAYLVID